MGKKLMTIIPYNNIIDWLLIGLAITKPSKKATEQISIDVWKIIVASKPRFVLIYSQDEMKENSITKIRYIIETDIPNEIFKCHIPQSIPTPRLLINGEYLFESCGSIKPLQPNSSQ